jgi:hypothetical protein
MGSTGDDTTECHASCASERRERSQGGLSKIIDNASNQFLNHSFDQVAGYCRHIPNQ